MITLGSLFDGSGGFPLAGALHGVVPLWASEVEPYPIAVTRSHFPQMKHLGNVTEIDGGKIPPVDVITFGSPCQSMSVAGKREGMKHTEAGDAETTRSGLFYEAIRIIQEMREATHGEYPKFAVWENVPGALSSTKGQDFHRVLNEFTKIAGAGDVPFPESGRWTNAGEIVGDGFSLAWRVLDAQYWGVPQRRRRIYLVADFAGRRAGKILFERESVSGDSSQGGAAREGAAADAEKGADGGCRSGCLNPWDPRSERLYGTDTPFPALNANSGGGQNRQGVCYALQGNGIDRADTAACNGCGWRTDQMYTLNTIDRPAVAFMAGQGAKARSIGAVEDGSPTLKGCPSGLNQAPSVVYPAIHPSLTARNAANVGAQRYNGVVYPTTARCYAATRFAEYKEAPPTLRASGADFGGGSEGLVVNATDAVYPAVARCLTAEADVSPRLDRGQNIVALDCQNPVVYDTRGNGDGQNTPTLTGDHENRVTDYTSVVCAATAQTNAEIMVDTSPALLAGHERPIVALDSKSPRRYIVRRLTPTECARLQGFPDCWGIPVHKDTMTTEDAAFWETVQKTYAAINGRAYKPCKGIAALVKWYNKLHTDSAEYKMWGNGIALYCAEFVIGGIVKVLQGDEVYDHDTTATAGTGAGCAKAQG